MRKKQNKSWRRIGAFSIPQPHSSSYSEHSLSGWTWDLSLSVSSTLSLSVSFVFCSFGSVAFCPFSGWISFIHIPPSLAHMQLFGLSHHYQDFTATCSFQCLTLAYQKCHLCNLNNINCLHLQSYLHKYCRKKVTILVVVKQKQMETASGEPMAGSFILNLWKTSGLCSQWLTWWDRSWPSAYWPQWSTWLSKWWANGKWL